MHVYIDNVKTVVKQNKNQNKTKTENKKTKSHSWKKGRVT
jgi:hypothetical protein